jgi:hypothetical protein
VRQIAFKSAPHPGAILDLDVDLRLERETAEPGDALLDLQELFAIDLTAADDQIGRAAGAREKRNKEKKSGSQKNPTARGKAP